MMDRRFLENLRLPVCSAPMFLVSCPQSVIAACRAGILGSFPTPNARTSADLEQWLEQISSELMLLAKERGHPIPWSVNLVTHSTNSRLEEDLQLIAKYQPPVVITALGSPRPAIETVHSYGGIVLADVTGMPLARKAIHAGADGLVCICAGAGGHTGSLSPFAFISAVRAEFDGLIFAGGGIADGWSVAGAICAGADIAYVGTRFIPAQESMAAPRHKELVLSESMDDLIISDAISGANASWLKASLVDAGIDPQSLAPGSTIKDYDTGGNEKKRWKEIFAAGQGVGRSQRSQTTAEIVEELESEYLKASRRFAAATGYIQNVSNAQDNSMDVHSAPLSP